jgi:hypothetical protein
VCSCVPSNVRNGNFCNLKERRQYKQRAWKKYNECSNLSMEEKKYLKSKGLIFDKVKILRIAYKKFRKTCLKKV